MPFVQEAGGKGNHHFRLAALRLAINDERAASCLYISYGILDRLFYILSVSFFSRYAFNLPLIARVLSGFLLYVLNVKHGGLFLHHDDVFTAINALFSWIVKVGEFPRVFISPRRDEFV